MRDGTPEAVIDDSRNWAPTSLAGHGPLRWTGTRSAARILPPSRRLVASNTDSDRAARPACATNSPGGSQGRKATRGIAPSAFLLRGASARSRAMATQTRCRHSGRAPSRTLQY